MNSSHENLKYVKEAEASARAFREYYPDADFLLYTDAVDFESAVFTELIPSRFEVPPELSNLGHKNGQMVVKLRALPELSHDRIMYLGSDTYPLKPGAGELFSLLDTFDVACAHAPVRVNTRSGIEVEELAKLPDCYPEFNCDLIVFRNTVKMKSVLAEWRDLYINNALQHRHDQGPFRYLCFRRDLRIATLPPEYNYRGKVFNADTIILQNRSRLPEYLAPPSLAEPSTSRPVRFLVRAANRLMRRSRFRVRAVR